MARRGVDNVRVMRTDARYLVQNHLPDACVSVLHLYHPDPWPKKRHHKRRLVQADFVRAVVRAEARGSRRGSDCVLTADVAQVGHVEDGEACAYVGDALAALGDVLFVDGAEAP